MCAWTVLLAFISSCIWISPVCECCWYAAVSQSGLAAVLPSYTQDANVPNDFLYSPQQIGSTLPVICVTGWHTDGSDNFLKGELAVSNKMNWAGRNGSQRSR